MTTASDDCFRWDLLYEATDPDAPPCVVITMEDVTERRENIRRQLDDHRPSGDIFVLYSNGCRKDHLITQASNVELADTNKYVAQRLLRDYPGRGAFIFEADFRWYQKHTYQDMFRDIVEFCDRHDDASHYFMSCLMVPFMWERLKGKDKKHIRVGLAAGTHNMYHTTKGLRGIVAMKLFPRIHVDQEYSKSDGAYGARFPRSLSALVGESTVNYKTWPAAGRFATAHLLAYFFSKDETFYDLIYDYDLVHFLFCAVLLILLICFGLVITFLVFIGGLVVRSRRSHGNPSPLFTLASFAMAFFVSLGLYLNRSGTYKRTYAQVYDYYPDAMDVFDTWCVFVAMWGISTAIVVRGKIDFKTKSGMVAVWSIN